MPQETVRETIYLKRGESTQVDLPPFSELRKLCIGPFAADETPHLIVTHTNVDPPDSLIYYRERVDQPTNYLLVYIMQNYGLRTVRVKIRRES